MLFIILFTILFFLKDQIYYTEKINLNIDELM